MNIRGVISGLSNLPHAIVCSLRGGYLVVPKRTRGNHEGSSANPMMIVRCDGMERSSGLNEIGDMPGNELSENFQEPKSGPTFSASTRNSGAMRE